ncbi:YetF domain-containing protein, partial [Legionella oakridgensis]|uniref:YetF domain-containing protein n=1 Tax=Legionella oakridgensis TaxID=29423 RepID=UPI0003DE38D5
MTWGVTHKFGKLVKGRPTILVKDGEIIWEALEKNQVSKDDLLEMVRDKLHMMHLNQIKEARLERTDKISFIIKNNN